MKKEIKTVATVTDIHTIKGEIPTGFYRTHFEGPVKYTGKKGDVVITPVDTQKLQAQKFSFVYQEGEMFVKGWFGLNGYTGKAHIEVQKTSDVHSLRDAQKLDWLINRCKHVIFKSIVTMGWRSYQNFLKTSKKKTDTPTTIVTTEIAKDAVEYKPSNVVVRDPKPAEKQKHRAARMETVTLARTVTYTTLSYNREGGWVKANPNFHYKVPTMYFDGVLKYQRRGGTVHRNTETLH